MAVAEKQPNTWNVKLILKLEIEIAVIVNKNKQFQAQIDSMWFCKIEAAETGQAGSVGEDEGKECVGFF